MGEINAQNTQCKCDPNADTYTTNEPATELLNPDGKADPDRGKDDKNTKYEVD